MASSDGKLVFPVYFDLESAVKQASGDADKALTTLEKYMKGRAIRPRIEVDTSAFDGFKRGMENSLTYIQSRMAKLQSYWNHDIANNLKFDENGKLSNKVMEFVHSITKLADGTTKINYEHLSPKQIYKEFVELTAAAKQGGVTLAEYARKQEQVMTAQEKDIQRTRELASLLTNESHARDILNQKLKFYTAQMNSAEPGTNKWAFNAQMVKQLRDELDKLDIKTKNVTGNAVKAENKAAQARAKETAAVGTLSQAYDALNAKLNALQSIRNRTDKSINPKEWQYATEEIIKTNHALTVLTAVQKASTQTLFRETEAVRTMVRELRAYGDTLGQLQTRLSAYQSMLNNTKVGGNAFYELSMQIRKANEELARGKQLAADYQAKAFIGLDDAKTKQKVAEVTQLRDKIAELDKQMNSLNQRGLGTDKNGNLTAEMVNKLNQRIALEKELNNILTTGAEAAKRKLEEEAAAQQKLIDAAAKRAEEYNRKRQQEAEDLAAQQKKAAEEARIKQESVVKEQQANEARKRILNEQKLSYDALMQKIQMLEAARNKTDIGAARWTRLTAEINKAKESLKVVTDEMDKSAKASERMARLREILSMSARSVDGLNARLNEHIAVLRRMDSGTAASADAFVRQGLKVARLSEELQRVNQYMADFQMKALQGVRGDLAESTINNLRVLRDEITRIDQQINNHTQSVASGRGGTMTSQQLNQLLDERIAKQKEIGEITKTAEQQALEREKQITAEMEKQRKKAEEIVKAQQRRKERSNLLKSQSKDIDTLTKKLQYYQNLLNRLDFNAKPQTFTQIAKEVERLTKELDKARAKMAELTGRSTSGASKQAANARHVNQEYSKQYTYLDRLIRRMAVYASVGMIGNFLTKVREVTAQFELQRISLGAILQDQNKANQLFSEIKSFALKSPVSILDLTKYTKQLAAYKVGYDELFETTKKLTDVSVGLGVSMDRVVLAYGQVRATGHLRASEVRQFTEMGVPIVEEIAAKLSKMNGEMVTAAQVMDMISKRAISFDMVKEVFNEMTSAGGIFYNMQEKQGNTLYGLWAKLGDAASVMYAEIGNTGIVSDAMKGIISGFTALMKNWRAVGLQLTALAAGFGLYKLVQNLTTVSTIAASKATRDYARAQVQLDAATKAQNKSQMLAAQYSMRAAAANRAAAMSTKFWTAAKLRLVAVTNQLKAALMGNWITLLITAVAAICAAIYSAYEKANRLKNTLADLKAETSTLQGQAVRNFEHLASAAVTAADGSKKQKDALDELVRTYKDVIPEESLRIENLRAMKGDYDSLTKAIREYIAAQQESKALEEVKNEYSPKIVKAQREAESALKDAGFGDVEIQRFFRNIERHYKEFSERFRSGEKIDIMGTIFDMSGIDKEKLSDSQLMEVADAYTKIVNAQEAWIKKEEAVRKSYRASTEDLGVYTRNMENYNKWVEKHLNSGESMFQRRQNDNMQIYGMEYMIRQDMQKAGLAWREEWANLVESVNPDDLSRISTLNMEAILAAIDPNKYPDLYKYIKAYRDIYNKLIPSNPTVQQIQNKFFSVVDSVGASMQKMSQFLWDGSGSIDDYLKRLKDQQDKLTALLKEKEETLVNWSLIDMFITGKTKEQIKAEIEETKKQLQAVNTMIPFVMGYTVSKKDKNKGGSKSDNRLQELQEMWRTLQAINKEYDDLSKKEGKTKAGGWITENYAETLKQLNALAKKFKLNFDFPLTADSLQKYGNQIADTIKSLKLKGGDKAVVELKLAMAKDSQARLEKQIEEQMNALADRISRTKTAKEFYDKILAFTGDYELAGQIADGIFGQDGRKLQSMLAEQVRNLTNGLKLPEGIISPDNIINSKALREWTETNKDELGDMHKELIKIAEEGQKGLAKSYEGYLKDLEKAKDYADKRVELARTTAEKIREIESEVKAGNYTKEQGENLKRGYLERETSEEAKLEWDAFKDMPIYTQMFEDMEHASTSTLTMMKNHLTGLKGLWGSALDPTQIKEIQGRIEEIEKQLETRNPWKTLRAAFGNYKDALADYNPGNAVRNVGMASEELLNTYNAYGKDSAQAKMAERELGVQKKILEISRQLTNDKGKRLKGTKALDKANQLAYRNQLTAQQELNNALADEQEAITKYGEDSEQYKAAHAVVEEKKEELKIAEKVSEITQENADTATKWKDSMATAVSEITKYMTMASDAARSIADLTEAFGGSEEDVQFWNDIADGLGKVTEGFSDLMQNIMSLNIAGIISSAITAIPKMIIGFMDIFSAGKIRKANKEIKRQQELLDQLEYSYSRLEKASERLFGKDYLQNHNQRLRALEAERQAYLKQARAEQSKGKKEDKAKTQEYLNNARDVADEIAELQDDLVSQITGTDVASAARDFANAWLDAYISFESTTGAIKEKFNDMIKNMIVNMVMARVVEKALQPIFDEIDRLAEDGNLSADDIGRVFAMVPQSMEDINNGLGVALRGLEAAGIDIRSLSENADSVSGIAKSISGATSEEINNLAAIGNTLMYYVSTLPRIDEKISRIVTIMESGGAGIGSASATGWTDWQQQAMDNYLAIQRNTADTVVECRRAANAAEESVRKLSRIITDKGSVSGINVFMKG